MNGLGLNSSGKSKLSALRDVDLSAVAASSTIIYDSTSGKWIALKNNLAGTAAPGVNDDITEGYFVNSLWMDLTAAPNEIYRCMDNSDGAAVWLNTSLEVGDLGSLAVLDTAALSDITPGVAENDFIIAGATPFTWLRKTLAEMLAIIMPSPGAIGETTPNTIRGQNKEVYITESGSLTAVQCSGTIVSNYGMIDADCDVQLPVAAEGLAFVCSLPAIRAKYFRLNCPSAQADKINLLVAGNWVAGSDDGYVGVASGYSGNAAISMYCAKVTDGGIEWFGIPLADTWIAG